MKQNLTIVVLVIALISVWVGLTTCHAHQTAENEQWTEMTTAIQSKEAVLDRLDSIMPLMDTVAEGDDYQDLLLAKENYMGTDNLDKAKVYYQNYCDAFDKVYQQCLDYLRMHNE